MDGSAHLGGVHRHNLDGVGVTQRRRGHRAAQVYVEPGVVAALIDVTETRYAVVAGANHTPARFHRIQAADLALDRRIAPSAGRLSAVGRRLRAGKQNRRRQQQPRHSDTHDAPIHLVPLLLYASLRRSQSRYSTPSRRQCAFALCPRIAHHFSIAPKQNKGGWSEIPNHPLIVILLSPF